MPGTFIQPLPVSDPDMHHRTCVMHVPWCMPESLTSGFIWSWWQGKCSRHCQRMRNPQFYVSGMRPIGGLKHPEIASPTVPNWSQISQIIWNALASKCTCELYSPVEKVEEIRDEWRKKSRCGYENPDRCQWNRVESTLRMNQHSWPLVSEKKLSIYQGVRTLDSTVRGEDIKNSNCHIHTDVDNTTTVAYMKPMGETTPPNLIKVTKDLCDYCISEMTMITT